MTPRARRVGAVAALAAFLALVVVEVVVRGSRPALEQGSAPAVLAVCSYGCLLAAAVLLLVPPRHGARRVTGGLLLGAAAVLVGLDVALDDGSPDIGGGFLRLVCLVVVVGATVRLALPSAPSGGR